MSIKCEGIGWSFIDDNKIKSPFGQDRSSIAFKWKAFLWRRARLSEGSNSMGAIVDQLLVPVLGELVRCAHRCGTCENGVSQLGPFISCIKWTEWLRHRKKIPCLSRPIAFPALRPGQLVLERGHVVKQQVPRTTDACLVTLSWAFIVLHNVHGMSLISAQPLLWHQWRLHKRGQSRGSKNGWNKYFLGMTAPRNSQFRCSISNSLGSCDV